MTDLDKFEKVHHSLNRPLLVLTGSLGSLACGYLSIAALNKNGDAAAIVRGVESFDQMLSARVVEATAAAQELGVCVGDTGADALEKFR